MMALTFSMQLIQVNILKNEIYLNTDQEITDPVNFLMETKYKLDVEKEQYGLLLTLTAENLQIGEKYATYEVEFIFQVGKFSETFKENDEGHQIPIEFEIITRRIGTSTLRGILISEFKNTPLKKLVLPLILLNALPNNQGVTHSFPGEMILA